MKFSNCKTNCKSFRQSRASAISKQQLQIFVRVRTNGIRWSSFRYIGENDGVSRTARLAAARKRPIVSQRKKSPVI